MSTPPEQPQSSQPPSAPPSQPPSQPTLPAQPSAYPYPNPQSPGGYGPPPSVPPQQNPYAQPQLHFPPGGYAPPPPPIRSGGAGRAVLWILLGAVVASALWAGGVFLLGGDNTPKADRGYQATSDLCSSVDYSSFKNEYPQDDSSPIHSALKADALDESYCSISLKKTSSSYSDAYFSLQVDLHHTTDPGPEFTAQWENYGDRYDGYKVEKITGIGDEAYVVTEDTTSGSTTGSRAATLAVRDGWMTYQMSWSVYLSSYDSDTNPPQVDEATQWLKTDTKATLEKLKAT